MAIYTTKGKYVTLSYLKDVEDKLDQPSFLRVHKSYLVAINKVEAIDNNELVIQSYRIPISRNYRELVIERVIDGKLWKK